jgi:DNA-binding CsgD family transcriptional regulator
VRTADYHFCAGDMARSGALIGSALTTCPAGPRRAALLLRLATIHYHQNGWPLAEQTFRLAAEQALDDPGLRARAEQGIAFARLMAGDLLAALQAAKVSLEAAERVGDSRLVADSLARVAAFKFLGGDGAWSALLDKAERLDASAGEELAGRGSLFHPVLVRGLILKWCDRLDEARPKLAGRYRQALDRGDEASLPFLLYHFSQLECWAGDWGAAEQYAVEGCRVAEEGHQQPMKCGTLYSLALVRAHKGQAEQARELASEALALCEQTGNVPVASQVVAVLGFLALSLGDHQAAHAHLGGLAEAIAAVGLGEPSVVKFLPDEIEALAALGEVDRAWSFTRQLEAQGKSLGRPWALAAAARCRAHLAAGGGDLQQARDACEQALSLHGKLSMPFELGRTLLVKGMIERRGRRKSEARATLGQAAGIFANLGAALWADKAREELSKIAAHSSMDGLTETERRIAALIAQGQTNREVAAVMFVTENTVQTHVRHIFRKLRVRSRTELAAQYRYVRAGAATGRRPAAGSERR